MGWSARGANYYLVCGWINVGTWCLRSEIDPNGTCFRDRSVGGCDIIKKGGCISRTR